MTEYEENVVSDIQEYHQDQDLMQNDDDFVQSLKEKTISDVLNKLIISDYSDVLVDNTMKIFTQEMKTGNLDTQDMRYVNNVFQLISQIRSFMSRYNIDEKKQGDYIKQLLVEVYSRISLSNSRNGSFIELMLKNISERTYNVKKSTPWYKNITR